MDKQNIIYDGRLQVSKAELINFLDNHRLPSPIDFRQKMPPNTHLVAEHFIQKYGEEIATRKKIENTINSVMGKPHPGKIFLHTFWHRDSQITWGWTYLQVDGGLVEFTDGQIELYPSKSNKKPFTNVIIKSDWAANRSYWEWMAQRLQTNFKELHKGGPKATPLHEKIKYVAEWKSIQGKELKENFCKLRGISISTLRNWERELDGLV